MKQHRRIGRNAINTWFWGYFFVAPVMFGITVFLIGPLFYAFYLSLTNWDGFVKANFVGFRNFSQILQDRDLYIEFFNTLKYMIGVVPCTIIIALGIANLLNQKVRGRSFFRTAFFLPMVTMPAAVAAVWRWLYNSQYGLVNYLTRLFGWNPMWLGDPRYILTAVIIVAIWSGIGYASIILLAGLQNIPKTYYEAAEIDGAGAFRKFTRITAPLLSPSIFFLTITSMIGAFKAFDLIFMFSGGGNSSGPASQAVRTMVYGIYHKGFVLMRMGYAAAEAVVLFAIILSVTLLQFYLQKKLVFYD
jgi:multiple sugar transport system permease protein